MQTSTISTISCFIILSTIFGTTFGRIISTDEDNDDTSYNYKFNYGVEDHTTGDIKSHHEVRLGKEVSGVYTVREADGTTRIVKYTAGPKTGFNAVVQNVGQAMPASFQKTGHGVPGTTSNFGNFNSHGLNLEYPGLQGVANERVVSIIAQPDVGSSTGYDFESTRVKK